MDPRSPTMAAALAPAASVTAADRGAGAAARTGIAALDAGWSLDEALGG